MGYQTAPDKSLVIELTGAKAVRLIFDLYIKGTSQAEIINTLNAQGFRTAQGKPFNKNSITKIIKNKKYIGTYSYDDIVIEDGIPPIISKNVFQLAQAECARRRTRKAPKAEKAEYLLSGKAFCGYCKKPLAGVSGTGKSGAKWYYYYCPTARAKKGCQKKHVKRDWLEDLVVRKTIEEILQPGVVEHLSQMCYEMQVRDREANNDVLFYKSRLAETKKAIKNTVRAIESGVVTKTLPQRLQELEEEQSELEAQLAVAEATDFIISADEIEFMISQFMEPFEGESWQDYKRRIIKCFVSRVYLFDDRLLIHYNVSADGRSRVLSEVALVDDVLAAVFDQSPLSSTKWSAYSILDSRFRTDRIL